jgi:hypothetical protein
MQLTFALCKSQQPFGSFAKPSQLSITETNEYLNPTFICEIDDIARLLPLEIDRAPLRNLVTFRLGHSRNSIERRHAAKVAAKAARDNLRHECALASLF